MRINGRNRLACKTLIKDLDISKPIYVEAIKGLPLEKDLIVDMEPFFDAYRAIKPYLITSGNQPTRERIQTEAARSPSGSSLHQMIRPRRSCAIIPAAASVARCLEIAARLMPNGAATSVTAMSSSSSIDRIARRVGSARAAKIASRS